MKCIAVLLLLGIVMYISPAPDHNPDVNRNSRIAATLLLNCQQPHDTLILRAEPHGFGLRIPLGSPSLLPTSPKPISCGINVQPNIRVISIRSSGEAVRDLGGLSLR